MEVKNIYKIIDTQIETLKEEREHGKQRDLWSECLELTGGIVALQGLKAAVAEMEGK